MGTMRVLTADAGDIKVEWDPEDEASVTQAKAEFDRLKSDGYEFYEVTPARGNRLKRWNKKLGTVIAAPGVKDKIDRLKSKTPGVAAPRRAAMAGGPNTTAQRSRRPPAELAGFEKRLG